MNMTTIWKPSVTVAAIIECDNKFLMVEEVSKNGLKINQPAGHLEPGESLLQGVIRETLEESAYEFFPESLVGTYLSRSRSSRTGEEVTYLRFAFTGKLGQKFDQPLDTGIVRTLWMSADEIATCPERHRNPLVWHSLQDYLRGQRGSLELVNTHDSIWNPV